MAERFYYRGIGSVVKSKVAGEADYIKINEDITLKKGDTLKLESRAQQLKIIPELVAAGKISEENGEKMIARAEKIPDFVRFEIKAKVPRD